MTTRRRQLAIAGVLVLATALIGAVARGMTSGRGGAGGGEITKARFAAPPSGKVKFAGHLDRTAVLRGRDGTVRMELEIGSDASGDVRARRVPTDLVIVLDRSGSMAGDKIVHAHSALRELIAELGPEDRFALVAYSNDAGTVIPLAHATAEAKRAWSSRVAEIGPDGGTNMSSGLDLGIDLIEHARESGRVPRVILISDGLANQGDSSQQGLTHRAGRAARGEYMLSAIGVGADFNEYLMKALADAGTGNYYYLRGSEDLAQLFAREFDAARSTVASGLAVRVEPGPGVRALDAGGYPLEREGQAVTFRPGALFAGQERRVWVTLAVPNDAVGERDLGRFSLAYDDGRERRTIAFSDTPRVACVEGENEFYAGVDVPAWTRSVVADAYNKMQEEVAREVKSGRRDQALKRLRDFKDEAAAMNGRLKSAPVAAQLGEADKLEREVSAAFEGANQSDKQNAFSKSKSADATDLRRAGSKK